MFNFRNRKRFGDSGEEISEEQEGRKEQLIDTDEPPAKEKEGGEAQAKAAEMQKRMEEEAQQQPQETCVEPSEPVRAQPTQRAEDRPDAQAAANKPQEEAAATQAAQSTEFNGFAAGEDFSDFAMNAFDGFDASAYEAAQPEDNSQRKKEEEAAMDVQQQERTETQQADRSETRTETIAEVEIAPAEGEVKQAAEPEAQSAHAETNSSFNPADYLVSLNYKDNSIFDVDVASLPPEEVSEFVEATRNVIKLMALNTNNLINLVQRKNKRLVQFDELAKLLENNQRDFENYKRRNADLTVKAQEEGFAKALTAVLPTLDNFERAIAMIPDAASAEGVVLIEKQLRQALEKLGVQEIQALGAEFDPNFHNAVMQQETDDAEQADKVVEVFQKGYLCGERVLRYAQVKVAKKY